MSINKQEYLNRFPYLNQYTSEKLDEFFSKIEKFQPDIKKLNTEQIVFLEDMFSALTQFNDDLNELKEYGLSFELGIAGGALRDVILNNSINIGDYDITLHINNIPMDFTSNELNINWNKLEKFNFKGLWKKYFSAPEPYYTPLPQSVNEKMLTNLIGAVLKQSNSQKIKEIHYANHEVGTYQNNSIYGLIKLENVISKKPIDLIITNRLIDGFVNTFSFDLCKTYYKYNNKHTFEDMVNNIIIQHSMLKDLENKTLTMNINHLSEENIRYYMNKHYKKMKEKYPEYTLDYRCRYDQYDKMSEYNIKLRELEVIARYYILQEKLENNSKKSIKLKI